MRLLALMAVGFIAGTPSADSRLAADPMADAAGAFLDSLNDRQREDCRFDFDDAERRNWQPVPFGDAGVRFEDLNATQRERLRSLLGSALSAEGLATVDGVMTLEAILVAIEEQAGRPSRFHGPERYFVTIYGEPRGEDPWGWRIEGHHLSMTFTCQSGEWTAHGPIFVGAQPARVRGGEHDGFRVLGHHDDDVRALLAMLSDEQRARAVGGVRIPGNVVLIPGRDDGFREDLGLVAAEMTPEQRAALMEAILDWAGWLHENLAAAEEARVKESLDRTRLYWLGGTGADEPHYWRIVGPHFAIEYAAPEADPDHVHALWRDLEHDLGGDLLRRHLERYHAEPGFSR
ncbi:MAG: DUF3500 domain-containing protein [Phycisphaeraceae bacterium]|nr:DUF3500 domain-containing protein [Phycisphaeraceae bacterium]